MGSLPTRATAPPSTPRESARSGCRPSIGVVSDASRVPPRTPRPPEAPRNKARAEWPGRRSRAHYDAEDGRPPLARGSSTGSHQALGLARAVTIGAIGWTAESFFDALTDS